MATTPNTPASPSLTVEPTPAWEYLDPPFYWKAWGGDVIADRTLADGTRQHLVRGYVPPNTVLGNAQVFGDKDAVGEANSTG